MLRRSALSVAFAGTLMFGSDQARAEVYPSTVAAGHGHTCAVRTDGSLWCWGRGIEGNLGNGGTLSSSIPVKVSALGNTVVEVAAGDLHTCARKSDNTLWCWGANESGQLGDGTTTPHRSLPVQVSALGNLVRQIVAGFRFTCARKNDGSLWCWGRNRDIIGGGGGTVNPLTSPVQVTSLGNPIAAVSAGSYIDPHLCARRMDGTLWCSGTNRYGEVGTGSFGRSTGQVTTLGTSAIEVTAGSGVTCARTNDGKAWCWGSEDCVGTGQVGDQNAPVQVASLGSSVAEISAGGFASITGHACARKLDGTVWCWGRFGVEWTTAPIVTLPVLASAPGSFAVELTLGGMHRCWRVTGDAIWCAGYNSSGQLGDGSTTGRIESAPVVFPVQAVPASAPWTVVMLGLSLLAMFHVLRRRKPTRQSASVLDVAIHKNLQALADAMTNGRMVAFGGSLDDRRVTTTPTRALSSNSE